jgi:hypothetical protein
MSTTPSEPLKAVHTHCMRLVTHFLTLTHASPVFTHTHTSIDDAHTHTRIHDTHAQHYVLGYLCVVRTVLVDACSAVQEEDTHTQILMFILRHGLFEGMRVCVCVCVCVCESV